MKNPTKPIEKPIKRSRLRSELGMAYYGFLRKLMWLRMNRMFAREKAEPLEYLSYRHQTPLLRKLKDVEMQLQYNKIVNLKLAAGCLNGVIIRPGQVFSYWKLIGKPTRRKGYIEGMVLHNGTFGAGVGGGLCQMSNMIFWLAVHTSLTVIERHRHGYDVFPDSNRTQPFGSGATCYYPHGDLMLRNDTDVPFQLMVSVEEEYLVGEIRTVSPMDCRYEIEERNHRMEREYWGGYSRHNELYQKIFDLDGNFLEERFLIENHAIMTYAPFIEQK